MTFGPVFPSIGLERSLYNHVGPIDGACGRAAPS